MGIRNSIYKYGAEVAEAVSAAKSGVSSGGKSAYYEMRAAKRVSGSVASGAASSTKSAYREARAAKRIAKGYQGFGAESVSAMGGAPRFAMRPRNYTAQEIFNGTKPLSRARARAMGTMAGATYIPRPGPEALMGARMGLPASPTRRIAREAFGTAAGMKTPMLRGAGSSTRRGRLLKYGAVAGAAGLGVAVTRGNQRGSAKNAGLPMSAAGMYGTTSTNPMTPKGF